MPVSSSSVANLIQGVSQQAPQQRRDSQCEAQYNCLNSPKDGAWARHGGDVVRFYPGVDFTNAFAHELIRGSEEHYLVLARSPTLGGLAILNLDDGSPGTIAPASDTGYLDTGGLPAVDCFCAQTVNDVTFLANRTVRPALGPQVAPSRPPECLVFVKASAYLTYYAISLAFGGVTYRWMYRTPDNSIAGNAAWLATNVSASVLYRAMTGTAPGGASGSTVGGVFNGNPGNGTIFYDASDGQPQAIQNLGFSIAINGNLLRIWRADGQDFVVDTSDGGGDSFLASYKGNVRAFTDLPRNGFAGFLLRVKSKATDASEGADFFVEYVNDTAASGFWRERPAAGVKTALDPVTMPHVLTNTGLNAFTFGPAAWSTRIAGDGVYTAKDPGFVGKTVEDLFYHKGRLGLLTEGTLSFSKARNVFTHFPDTVQTLLADAPVGLEIAGSGRVALLQRAALVAENLFVWAQGAQFKVGAGGNPFRESSVEADPSTAYEFSKRAGFAYVGTQLYFATEPGDFCTLRALSYDRGVALGDTDVTAQVPDYVPAGVRQISPSDTGQVLFLRSDSDPSSLYVYNYYLAGREVVQSAWNKWTLPVSRIVWTAVYRQDLLVLAQRPDGAILLRFPLRAAAVDHLGAGYRTRLDLRVAETACAVSYDQASDTTTIQAPYRIFGGDSETFRVVSRVGTNLRVRGREAGYAGLSPGGGLIVKGDWTGQPFYLGTLIASTRQESPFYLRSDKGEVPVDELTIREFNLSYAATGYTRIEADTGAGRLKKHETRHIPIGSALAVNQPPIIRAGRLSAVVDCPHEAATITLVNDTWLPSRWQTAEWRFQATVRARVAGAK